MRFDVAVVTRFPVARKGRLAQQIRQDLWRALQCVRGFSPVVRVEEDGTHLLVRAGGTIHARAFPKQFIEQRITNVLDDPDRRSRWLTFARKENAHA